jgi:signal transduction histidine kinase
MDAFATLLVSEGIVSAEQLAEAVRMAQSSGKKVQDEVVRLGYAPGERVMKALAKAYRLKFVDLSKLEAKRMALEFEDVVVDEVAEAAMTIVRPTARKKRIALSTTWASRGRFACDARRVRQILVNLLGNAIKFTGEGGRVELLVEDALDEDAIRFTVEDSGIGIAPHDLARLFQPFVQVDGRLTRRHEGTGLGLALVRRLAELHGGRVEATSEPGKGSRFSVVLPVDPRAVPDQRVSRTSLQPARLEAPEDAR